MLAARLGLADAPQWHSQRDRVAELANWLSPVTGTRSTQKFSSRLPASTPSNSPAWTLEWMILPQMLIATGASSRLAGTLINRIQAIGR